jgi:tRNA-splicing ligase RtcB
MTMNSSSSQPDGGPPVRQWLTGPVPPEVAAAIGRLARAADVRRVAVMPDVHLAADVCVGTVLATGRLLYPAAVGGDIGCGVLAVAFDDCDAAALADEATAAAVFRRLYERVPTNRHRRLPDLPANLAARPLSDPRLAAVARRDGRAQLGTLGRGNHFLEFHADEDGRLWLAVHSGSRAVGQAVRDWHVGRAAGDGVGSVGVVSSAVGLGIAGGAGRPTSRPAGLVAVDAETAAGRAYLADAEWARAYADANRRAMAAAAAGVVREVLGGRVDEASVVSCGHNHVRRETHFGDAVWVHRKGAMSAAAGESGVLPGSMGTATFHVEGRGEAEALCSSAHGAGRAMSRERARAAVSERELRRQMAGVWFDPRAAPRLRDEAPAAYKDVAAVLRAQRDLTRVVRRLRPVLVYKGV